MTDLQRLTRKQWRDAKRAHRNAAHGFRDKTRAAFEAAALAVIRADTEARRANGIGGTDGSHEARP